MFLHYGLWNPEKFRIDTSGKISNPPIRNSKYTFHIQKSIIKKKSILDPPTVTEIYISDLEIHN